MPDNNPLGSVGTPDDSQPDPNIKAAAPANPNIPPNLMQPPLTPAQAPVIANPAAVTIGRHAKLGAAFQALMGHDVSYQVDPSTGKLVEQETPRQPGQLWRGILAATILGGATASKNRAPGFVQGFAEGGAGVIDEQKKQDLVKRQQAREQFEDQLKAQQNKRAERSAQTEEQLRQAQIAFHNAQTLHENKLMQREDFDFHQKVAEAGKVQVQPYKDAGLTAKFDNVDEADMPGLFKNNPDAQKLLWEPTGTRVVIGADGQPDVHATYSAFDPKGKIKVTDDQLTQWKKEGLDQVFGKTFFDVVKKDKELDVQQYMALTHKEQELTNAKYGREKQDLDLQEKRAKITFDKAQAAHLYAEASKIRLEAEDQKLLEAALDASIKGGDLTKLSPRARKLAVDVFNNSIKADADAIKALPKNELGQIADQAEATEMYKGIEAYQKARGRLLGIKPEDKTTANVTGDKVRVQVENTIKYVGKNDLDNFLKANPDTKTGDEITVSPQKERAPAVDALRNGSAVKFTNSGPPSLGELTTSEQLLTDGGGNYIIRDKNFKNPQWKSVGIGTIEPDVISGP